MSDSGIWEWACRSCFDPRQWFDHCFEDYCCDADLTCAVCDAIIRKGERACLVSPTAVDQCAHETEQRRTSR